VGWLKIESWRACQSDRAYLSVLPVALQRHAMGRIPRTLIERYAEIQCLRTGSPNKKGLRLTT
jgi:hypothetical protein